ncbi:MAG: Hsp20/alpha crystallin family protein [Candidatus Woesearchaeota archaeon]
MYWDPFEEMRRMQEEMNRIFYKPLLLGTKELTVRTPVTDIKETEKSVIATFELPGADKKDIELNVTDDYVEVKVKKKQELEKKTKTEYRYEASAQQYYRKIALPTRVIAEKAEATYKDGVLRVEIPKQAAMKGAKKIQIK